MYALTEGRYEIKFFIEVCGPGAKEPTFITVSYYFQDRISNKLYKKVQWVASNNIFDLNFDP